MRSDSEHWDKIFKVSEDEKLGWFENDFSKTFELLNKISKFERKKCFLAGVGTSCLADELFAKKNEMVLNDISIEALNRVKKRVGRRSTDCEWLCHDLSTPLGTKSVEADIWIDRAVLHFLTEESGIEIYFNNLRSVIGEGGYALFAEFSKSGALKCAGLELHRYDVDELSSGLGESFELVSSFEHIYINPSGDPRPYIYALFKRNKK